MTRRGGKLTIYKCDRCGVEFAQKLYDEHSIEFTMLKFPNEIIDYSNTLLCHTCSQAFTAWMKAFDKPPIKKQEFESVRP